ncbi:MAG: single-stranded-DNA-specific exonuclease RecJ [Endomicrobiales bacterium]|nr:single-stranded-DNA-specific exonuclease RecJ [Endomicrobiales bacterium]
MNKNRKKWRLLSNDNESAITEIASAIGLSRTAAMVLVNRGIRTAKEAEEFLSSELSRLHSPFLLPDIEKAVERIRKAIDSNERILIYGDRDVDGIAAVSIMVRTFRSLGADPFWHIPSDEGYGLHRDVIDKYIQRGITFLITVDCGISALDEVAYAKSKGIDVVITDHHETPSCGMPDAVAVVNPKREDSCYPFKELAGCTVSFKVCEALMYTFGKSYNKNIVAVDVKQAGPGVFELGAAVYRNGVMQDKRRFALDAAGDSAETKRIIEAMFLNSRVILRESGALRSAGLDGEYDTVEITVLMKQYLTGDVKTVDEAVKYFKLEEKNGEPVVDGAEMIYELYSRLERMSDLRMSFYVHSHLDLIALGTIADIMPLNGENRALVKHGLVYIANSKKAGVQRLFEKASSKHKNKCITAKFISWNLTPILNAAGRLGRADLSCELLITEDKAVANKLIYEIMKLNDERRELQAANYEVFLPLLKQQCDVEKDKIFVVTAEGVEHGVTGIIASQLVRLYHRPCILLIIEGEEAMGAARSVEGFDIAAALDKMSDILIKHGGHSLAAGLTVSVDKIGELRSRLKETAEETLSRADLVPSFEIDMELDFENLNKKLLDELLMLEPFGMGNPFPLFCVKNVKISEYARIGNNGDHLRMKVTKNGGTRIGAIGWGLGYLEKEINEYGYMDIAVQLEYNSWQEKRNLQLLVCDLKPSEI